MSSSCDFGHRFSVMLIGFLSIPIVIIESLHYYTNQFLTFRAYMAHSETILTLNEVNNIRISLKSNCNNWNTSYTIGLIENQKIKIT